jgi:NtrC-family two-component system sensor histidine kinase KinB
MLGVEQLSVLVDEFLDLTRIEAGQLRLQWARVGMRELLDQAVRAAEPLCTGVQLTVEHGGPDSIAGDPARLAMVVSNLLSNAIKHTPTGGRITVRSTPTEIIVDDSGPGVPAELRERIFERFFRADTTTSGVGIGLYIARQVIEAHGGTLRCDDSPLGGARFTVTLDQTKTPVNTSLTTVK